MVPAMETKVTSVKAITVNTFFMFVRLQIPAFYRAQYYNQILVFQNKTSYFSCFDPIMPQSIETYQFI